MASTPEDLGNGRRRRARKDESSPRRRRRPGSSAPFAMNIAPMIDVTFLLLIFFLVTTTFERAEGILASKMPQDVGEPAVALPISPIIVRVSQVGPGAGDYAIRIDDVRDVPADFTELAAFLSQIHSKPGFDADTLVVVVAGDHVKWDHVVGAWNAAVHAGCTNVAFGQE